MDPSKYKVEFSEFSDRHHAKDFAKKYRSNWAKTRVDITDICSRIDRMLAAGRQQVDLIKALGGHKLIKLDFAVEGTHESPRKSGNRAIIWVDETERKVTVLMLYGKGHVKGKQETAWWQKQIRDNCKGIDDIFWPPGGGR
ncbi:hypothetical protein F4X86_02575 [Candidatus Saccharibacteria bacterium]|nr:hypothetical protein [Candidatus Saccharibacteria bacterium]